MFRRSAIRRRPTVRGFTPRRGFSLLEMLIVLAILSALTMVAVQSLGPVEQQARYETTKRTLEAVKGAIISVNQNGGTSSVGGLTADTSLLPDLTSAPAFYNSLVTGAGMPEPATYMIDGLSATYGWRGPYVQANLTTTQFVDGWGRALGVEIQDVGGATKTAFTHLSDRLVISNAATATATTTVQFASITIPGNALSATQLTVNMYGLDLTGNRITLTGTSSPLTQLPQVFLQGGLDPTTKLVTTITGTVTATGTACTCQITPPLPQLLVGVRTLSVITPTLTTTAQGHYETYSPIQQLNLLPGTSPIVELLIVRQTSAVTTGT